MEELQKWELINSAETTDKLKDAIAKIGPVMGRRQMWTAEHMIGAVDKIVIAGGHPHTYRILTRSYGIRQQMIYLMTYE